jgi:hypothetical protein
MPAITWEIPYPPENAGGVLPIDFHFSNSDDGRCEYQLALAPANEQVPPFTKRFTLWGVLR